MILIICMLQKHFAILEQSIEFCALLLEKEFLEKIRRARETTFINKKS